MRGFCQQLHWPLQCENILLGEDELSVIFDLTVVDVIVSMMASNGLAALHVVVRRVHYTIPSNKPVQLKQVCCSCGCVCVSSDIKIIAYQQ